MTPCLKKRYNKNGAGAGAGAGAAILTSQSRAKMERLHNTAPTALHHRPCCHPLPTTGTTPPHCPRHRRPHPRRRHPPPPLPRPPTPTSAPTPG